MSDVEKSSVVPLTERGPGLRLRRAGPRPTAEQLMAGSAKFSETFPESGPPEQISGAGDESGPAAAGKGEKRRRAVSKMPADAGEVTRFQRRKKSEPRSHNMTIRFTYAERVRLQDVADKLGHASATDYLRAGIEHMLEADEKKLGA